MGWAGIGVAWAMNGRGGSRAESTALKRGRGSSSFFFRETARLRSAAARAHRRRGMQCRGHVVDEKQQLFLKKSVRVACSLAGP